MIGVKTGLDITSVNKTKQEFTKLLNDLQNQANRNPIRINISNTTSQINSINNSMNTLGRSATDTSNSFKGLGSSLGTLTGFYMRWLSVSSLVNLALMETRKAINFAFEQDERVRNVSMISGEDRKTVQGYTQDWLNLGLELKQSTSIIAESNEEWLRAGANLNEINELTKMTVKTSEIAGSAIKDTTSQAIALKNAYSLTNNELKGVLESVVKMDNTSSTGTDKLLRSLLVVAPSAKQAKAPIEWLVAGLTTVQSKSKQTAESVGKNFRNIFLNMTKMTNGENQIGLNKAEDQLNKINIAMRSNTTTFRSADKILDDLGKTWNTLTEVQQAELSMSLAGKENSNSFNILMQNQAETLKNLNNIKLAGGSLDKAYEEHLKSAKGALGELKASLEQVYTQMINGDGLKSVLNDLTRIVHFVGFLITDGKELTKVWIGLLIAIKNFKLLEVGIMGCVTAFKYLKVFGLEALTLLSFNPIVLSVVALVAILATVTYSQYKHSQQVKELKNEYDLLNKSMSEMNGDEIKKNTEKLKEHQKELDKLLTRADVKVDMGFGIEYDLGQRNLDKYIKTLAEAGFHVDATTNKLIELSQAESNIATSDTIKSIQDKTNSTIEESTETQNLISQYQSLSQQENLSAEKKKLLSGLTQQLVSRVDGLQIATDEHGNSVITNTGYLGTQIDVLELLKQSSIQTANAQIEGAINSSSAIHNGTVQTLDDMKAIITSQQILASALSNSPTGKAGFFDTQLAGIDMNVKNLEASVAKIETLKSKFAMKTPAISNITSSNQSGYKPTGDSDKATKDKQDIANLEAKTDRYYTMESALQSVEIELDRLNSLESNATESEKLKLKEKEISLLAQKKLALQAIYREQEKENQSNADKLKSQGAKFDNEGNITNRNQLLTSKTNSANSKTGDAKKVAQESVKQFEEDLKNYEDLRFSKIVDVSSKIFSLEQDRINKIAELEKIKFNNKLENINKMYGQESQQIEDIKYKLDEINAKGDDSNENITQRIKFTEDLIKATEDYNVQLLTGYGASLNLLDSTKEGTEEWEEANSSVEEYKDKLKSTNIELLNLSKTLKDIATEKLNKVQEMQNKIGEVIKQQYEDEKEIAIKSIDEIQKNRDRAHKNNIDNLNKEKKANEDIFNDKLSQIDKEENAKDFNDNSSKLLNEKNDLQKQFDLLSFDNSRESVIKRDEIAKQIAEKQLEIDKLSHTRSTDLRKENIKEELEDYQKSMDVKIENANLVYESDKELLEKRKFDIESYYANKLKQSNIFIESQEALEKGYINRIKKQVVNGFLVEVGNESMKLDTALTTYMDNFETGLSVTGNLIKTELIDNLKTVMEIMNELSSNKGINLSGNNVKTPMLANTPPNSANLKSLMGNITMPSFNLQSFIPKMSNPNLNSMGNKGSTIQIDNLINVEGNVDKSVMGDLQRAGQDSANLIIKALRENG